MDHIGKYKILGILGKGGMGIVYKALDPDIEREVAIKTIRFENFSEGTQKDDLIVRFIREARAAGKLSHANIVTVYDVGRESDLTYIVMQYIEGRSLQALIDAGKRFSPPEIRAILEPIANALSYAHQNGIIHRDIKPANILIDKAGKPFLVDFGVARMGASTMTQSGMAVGTLGYMSPEQVKGQTIDQRSDIFALGIILYELLTGKLPFDGENISTIVYKIVHEKPPRVTEIDQQIPPAYESVVEKSLAKNPDDRYQNCRQLIAGLESASQALEGTLTFDTDSALPAEGGGRGKKKALWAGIALAALLVALVGGRFLLFPKAVKKADAKPAASQAAPKAQPAPPPAPAGPPSEALTLLKQKFEAGALDESSKLAEDILAKFPSDPTALEVKAKVQSRRLAERVAPDLQAGIASFNQHDYAGCLERLGRVLAVDRTNAEALKYSDQAEFQVAQKEILAVIERHRAAEESKDLPVLLADVGSPDLKAQWDTDHRLLFNGYDEIHSAIENITVKTSGRLAASAVFSHLLTGVYKRDGTKKILFDGNETWQFRKSGGAWTVTGAN